MLLSEFYFCLILMNQYDIEIYSVLKVISIRYYHQYIIINGKSYHQFKLP